MPAQETKNQLPIVRFENQDAWANWLSSHHADSPGVWIEMAKKATGIASITYDQAVDVALCYGWIDGQKNTSQEGWWVQKFTPRGRKSVWSKVNREKVARLTETGQVQPAGLAAIEQAKSDGRWDAAYDSPSNATIPDDFQAALDQNAEAKAFFATLNSRNRYTVLYRIQTAKKAETRAKRIAEFISMLEQHKVLYP